MYTCTHRHTHAYTRTHALVLQIDTVCMCLEQDVPVSVMSLSSILLPGLPGHSQAVHCHPGALGEHCGRFLEDGLGAELRVYCYGLCLPGEGAG